MDQETITLLQSFGFDIGKALIASAIVEWKKLKDDREAQSKAALYDEIDHAKSLAVRIQEKISQGLRGIKVSKAEAELLLPFASDPLLAAELGRKIVSDEYGPESVTALMLENRPELAPAREQVQKLAAVLLGSIQQAIAEDPNVHRLKELQFQAKTSGILGDLGRSVAGIRTENQGITDMVSQLSGKADLIFATLSSVSDGLGSTEQLKSIVQKRFESARDEQMHGSIVLAERAFRDLINELEGLGPKADKNLLFRSYANLGTSLWHQNRRDEATVWFEKAFKTFPNDPRARTKRALCHIHRREWGTAIEILDSVRHEKPDDFEPLYLISCIQTEMGRLDEAKDTLESKGFQNDDYFVALAQAYSRLGEHERAAETVRNALKIKKHRSDALFTLANALAFPIVNRRLKHDAAALSLTETDYARMLEAVDAAETACKTSKSEGRFFQLGELLSNLSAFYEILGKKEDALRCAAEAVEINPESESALKNLWSAQMKRARFGEAYDTAATLKKCGFSVIGNFLQFEALLADGKCEKLIAELEAEPNLATDLKANPRYFEIKAGALFESHEITGAFDAINEGLNKFPQSPALYCTRASLYEETGQLELAENDFKAAEKSGGVSDLRSVYETASFYLRQQKWGVAAAWLSRLNPESVYSFFLNDYLICLFNLKEYSKCSELAGRAIEKRAEYDEVVYDLAARCAYYSNELPKAEKLLEKLVQHKGPNILEHQKRLAQTYLRMDEPEKALGVLKKAFARHSKDIDVLVSLAYASTLVKQHEDALYYAVLAVKASPENERAHLALVKAASECPPEFQVDDGARQGIQQSFAFLEKHPSGYIKSIPIEPDFKSFIEMARTRAEYAHKVQDLVREKNLPMSFLGEQLGLSAFQAWSVLTRHKSLHVSMAYGTSNEQTDEIAAVQKAAVVCMDAFALITMCLLKQMHLLPKLFTKIYVHMGTFESIASEIHDIETHKNPFFISYHEGKLVHSEIAPEQIQQSLSFLKEIREFLKSQTELIGAKPSNDENERTTQATTVLGRVSYETIIAAKEREASYFSDDAPMRSFASIEFNVSGFCTQALLRFAKDKKVLTESQYEECIVTLIRNNYYFVYETADTLIYLVKAEGFKMSETLSVLIFRVADPKVNRDAATRILSDFCLFLWGADYSNFPAGRDYWLGICIEALLKAKEPEELFIHFVSTLAGRTLMNPELFYGVTGWVLRCKALSMLQRDLFYRCVQQAILQMCSLVTLEAPWLPSLRKRWRVAGRMNIILWRNGWI